VFKDNDAFASFSIDDVEAARQFYADTLGLTATVSEMGFLDITLGTGARVLAYSKPNHQPATFTVLSFIVADIERAVDDLVAAGVQMEHYDLPDIRTDPKGIARTESGPPIAWFTDPAGNIIAVLEAP
jgi:catechol 2,3-dioxygenase-like lactoylglutathione lyase family enzyme